jgi:D-alanyl-lipoteichoic acid acyltransferase DltB (MBOAT superfamily)
MLFNSIEFCYLLGVTLIAYWMMPNLRVRQGILLVSSLVFYAYWYPPYLAILLSLVILSYFFGILTERYPRAGVWSASLTLLGILCYYKYSNYFAGLIDQALWFFGNKPQFEHFDIKLPLGISFMVFQLLGYIVDVAKKEIKAEKNIVFVTLFISYFPHLIAGPICRATQLIPQLRSRHKFDSGMLGSGFVIFSVGLILKIIFADNFAPYVDQVFKAPDTFSGFGSLCAAVLYGFQIYADFWGYSTMAVGISLMFGISVPINFNLPYHSSSLQDFWRRWHITLSVWLRDYLYIPLGGSRGTEFQTQRNLVLTMLLGGLWHGANTTFIVWGAIHGLTLAIERATLKQISATTKASRSFQVIHYVITMVVVFIAWIFFRAQTSQQALEVLTSIFSLGSGYFASTAPKHTLVLAALFVVIMKPATQLISNLYQQTFRFDRALVFASWTALLVTIFASSDVPKFIYFDF